MCESDFNSKPELTRLAVKLRKVRIHLGLSQSKMAKIVAPNEDERIYRARISQYELALRVPPIPQLLAYARAAEINVETLMDDSLDLELNY